MLPPRIKFIVDSIRLRPKNFSKTPPKSDKLSEDRKTYMNLFKIMQAVILFTILGLSGCDEGVNGIWPDDSPPVNNSLSVRITSPSTGERFDDVTIIEAAVESDYDIDRVEIEVDGRIISTDTEAPYECEWFVWFWADSCCHTITAAVHDEYGNTAASERIDVVVDPGCWREPRLMEPLDGAVLDSPGFYTFKWYPFEGAKYYTVQLYYSDYGWYYYSTATCKYDWYFYCSTDTFFIACNGTDEVIDIKDIIWTLYVSTPGKAIKFDYSFDIYVDCSEYYVSCPGTARDHTDDSRPRSKSPMSPIDRF